MGSGRIWTEKKNASSHSPGKPKYFKSEQREKVRKEKVNKQPGKQKQKRKVYCPRK